MGDRLGIPGAVGFFFLFSVIVYTRFIRCQGDASHLQLFYAFLSLISPSLLIAVNASAVLALWSV